jgi:hypothetical protein
MIAIKGTARKRTSMPHKEMVCQNPSKRKSLNGCAIPLMINTNTTTNNAKAIVPAIKRKKALNKTPIAWPMPLATGLAVCLTSEAKL